MSSTSENRWSCSTVDAELRALSPSLPFLELWIHGPQGIRHIPFLENRQPFQVQTGDATTPAGVSLSEHTRLLCHPVVELSPAGQQLFDSKLISWRLLEEKRRALARTEISNHSALQDSEDRGPVRLSPLAPPSRRP